MANVFVRSNPCGSEPACESGSPFSTGMTDGPHREQARPTGFVRSIFFDSCHGKELDMMTPSSRRKRHGRAAWGCLVRPGW
ncbi:hypothetical protein BN844_5023 [Pseudomonas sp. SHC52]|nr:hypothetical protein BN844_5023 [Pseudomonas sp. SHC52]